MNPLESLIIYDALLLLCFVAWGIYMHWKIDATLYISFFLFVCGVISTVYYPFADGVQYDYSVIRLVPFLYLVMCYIITAYPIMRYDMCDYKAMSVSEKPNMLIEYFCIFLILVSIEPALEIFYKVPSMIGNESAIDDMYEARLVTEYIEPLSGLGRKFFRITTTFQYLYPVFLFYFLSKPKIKIFIVLGILMMIGATWGHQLIAGGRSGLVQSFLYLLVCYFVMFRFIPRNINRKILIYGGAFLSLGVIGFAAVTMARFNQNEYVSEDFTVWLWMGLYAGEGNLNFSSMMWDVVRDTGGIGSLVLPMDFLGLVKDNTVAGNWAAMDKLGVPGNIFYTYVGVLYADFGRIGAVVFLVILASVVRCATKTQAREISLTKVAFICLLAKILVLPTFYTYASYMNQLNLLMVLIFLGIYSLRGRVYIGNRLIF